MNWLAFFFIQFTDTINCYVTIIFTLFFSIHNYVNNKFSQCGNNFVQRKKQNKFCTFSLPAYRLCWSKMLMLSIRIWCGSLFLNRIYTYVKYCLPFSYKSIYCKIMCWLVGANVVSTVKKENSPWKWET